MKAAVKRMGDVTVISIEGVLEIEHTQPFRQICIQKFVGQKLVFNMRSASFVGSTGLQSFLDTVKTIDASNSYGLKMVGVKPEFRRLLANIETQKLSFFDEVNSAVQSFTLPPPEVLPVSVADIPSATTALSTSPGVASTPTESAPVQAMSMASLLTPKLET